MIPMTTTTSRSYSTDFKDHANLLHNLTKKAFGRMTSANAPMEYDDIYQTMCLSFAKCISKWNPNVGVSFTAYMGRACWNDFNKLAEKMINERIGLNLTHFEDMRSYEYGEHDDENPLERFQSDESQEVQENPEDACARVQEARKNLEMLSHNAKVVIKELLHPSRVVMDELRKINEGKCDSRANPDVTVRFIAKCYNLPESNIARLKSEFKRKLGVTFR